MGLLDRIASLFAARKRANVRSARRRLDDGGWMVDVRGQTCPGYLLDINRHVTAIGPGARIRLLVSYPPCGDDVRAWCAEKGYAFKGITRIDDHFGIDIAT